MSDPKPNADPKPTQVQPAPGNDRVSNPTPQGKPFREGEGGNPPRPGETRLRD